MPALTKTQRGLLQALIGVTSMDCDELAKATGKPREGAAATAASLVRKGLVDRFYANTPRRHVRFAATDAGVREIAAR